MDVYMNFLWKLLHWTLEIINYGTWVLIRLREYGRLPGTLQYVNKELIKRVGGARDPSISWIWYIIACFLSYVYKHGHTDTHTHTHTHTRAHMHTHTHTHTDRGIIAALLFLRMLYFSISTGSLCGTSAIEPLA